MRTSTRSSRWCRAGLQLPEVILATAATVIASQAVISGSYTVARQAMQLGFLPRLRVVHTSEMEGQVYVPIINWILAAGVIALVLVVPELQPPGERLWLRRHRHVHPRHDPVPERLHARCGIRPSGRLALLGALFLTVEVAFFLANVAKLLPRSLAAARRRNLRLDRDADVACGTGDRHPQPRRARRAISTSSSTSSPA